MNSSHQLKILKILIVFGLLKIRLHQFYLTYIFNDFFTVITPKNILFYTEYETSEQQLDSKFNNKINPCLNSAQEISETQESSWMCPSSFYHLDFSLSCLNSDCWVVFYFFFCIYLHRKLTPIIIPQVYLPGYYHHREIFIVVSYIFIP